MVEVGTFNQGRLYVSRNLSFVLVAQLVKNLPAMQETQVWTLGQEDPLGKGMATHSSILAWKIPWTESLVVYNPWGHKNSDMTERLTFSLQVVCL